MENNPITTDEGILFTVEQLRSRIKSIDDFIFIFGVQRKFNQLVSIFHQKESFHGPIFLMSLLAEKNF